MPTTSTRNRPEPKAATRDGDFRLETISRRISEGYYDRSEVRRTVASLLLRSLARRLGRPGSSRPETA